LITGRIKDRVNFRAEQLTRVLVTNGNPDRRCRGILFKGPAPSKAGAAVGQIMALESVLAKEPILLTYLISIKKA
jgi:hypothetical protein